MPLESRQFAIHEHYMSVERVKRHFIDHYFEIDDFDEYIDNKCPARMAFASEILGGMTEEDVFRIAEVITLRDKDLQTTRKPLETTFNPLVWH